MSRAVDSMIGDYFINFSPKYLMFSGWVGDQQGGYLGMKRAILNMFHSAWNNYLNFGCDIGGYDGAANKQ